MKGDRLEVPIVEGSLKSGKQVKFGRNVIIYGDVEIGDGVVVEDNVILGYNNLTHLRPEYKNTPQILRIGDDVLIRSNSIVYAGCEIGNNTMIGHSATLREFTILGHHSIFGSYSICEGYTKIGNHVFIQSQIHITAKVIIEDYVFIGPHVTTANGYHVGYFREATEEIGPHLCWGSIIGSHSLIMPGVRIGREAIVGGGAVVTKDVPDLKVALGIPARVTRDVRPEERIDRDQIKERSRWYRRLV